MTLKCVNRKKKKERKKRENNWTGAAKRIDPVTASGKNKPNTHFEMLAS